eukprot:927514-Amphidinium_carterae.1
MEPNFASSLKTSVGDYSCASCWRLVYCSTNSCYKSALEYDLVKIAIQVLQVMQYQITSAKNLLPPQTSDSELP